MRFSARVGLLVLLVLIPMIAFGQLDTGAISGRVVDQSGAAVPGASVTVVQTEMNFENVTQTNAEGLYRVQSLRPGPYRVTVSAAGFKKVVRENQELRIGDNMAVDVALEVGAVTDSVEVTAAAALLETQTSATGQVLPADFLYAMPIYQREAKALFYLTPGLSTNGPAYAGQMNNFHVNGLQSTYIGYFEDGVYATGTDNNGLTSDTILNTVEEVKVLTTALPAEFGHSAGGAISVAKKTGTNQIHGLASEFGRTRMMQHRKFFDQWRNSQVIPVLHPAPDGEIFQQPDFNANGPVYIPKIYDGRNKTFFMFGWQWLLEKQAKYNQYTVPDANMLAGNFAFGGIGQQIYDPRTTRQDASGNWLRDPFVNNIIPVNQFDPVAAKVLSFKTFAAPNQPPTMTTSGPTNNLALTPVSLADWPNYSARIDQQFTENVRSFFGFTYNARYSPVATTTVLYQPLNPAQNQSPTFQTTYSQGNTWLITPTLISDTRFGYYRRSTPTWSPFYNQNVAGLLGIPNVSPVGYPGGLYGLGAGGPSTNVDETLSFKQDFTTVRGAHSLKAGYELMRYRVDSYDYQSPSGSFSFTGTGGLRTNGTALPNTGNSFAGFLIGSISSASFSTRLNANLPRSWQNSAYVQDDWRVSPTLTLNLGLRYSVETPPTQKWGFISIFNPNGVDDSTYNGVTCPSTGCMGVFTHPKGAKPYNTDWRNIQPRAGLAWHPSAKLVVRSGFALTTVDQKLGYLYTDEMMTYSANAISRANGDPRPLFQISQGPPTPVYPALRADGSVPFVGNPGGHGASMVDPNLRSPYTMSWNLGLQYELSKNYVIETTYSGSGTVGNVGGMAINTQPWGLIPNPNGSGYLDLNDPANAAYRNTWLNNTQVSRPWNNWGNITYYGNYGHGTHHEATVKLEKRYSRGLTFLTFYTYGRSIDGNVSNEYLSTGLNKGRSTWDQPHRFVGSMTYEIPIGKGRHFLNRGGILNALVGQFDFAWNYTIESGSPAGIGITGQSTQNYPSWMPGYGNVLLTRVPQLRDNWQDLGRARFSTATQNSLIDCAASFQPGWGNNCFTYAPSFTRGDAGRDLWYYERVIVANLSASKEIPIRERLRFQFRFDFQNPFKWYNWNGTGNWNTTLDINNPQLYGKVTPGQEQNTALWGGVPLMNITLALKW